MTKVIEQRVYSGVNAYKNLNDILKEVAPQKIFLVTGKLSYTMCTAETLMNPTFERYKACRFWDFQVNPRFEDVKRALDLYKEEGCDMVVGVGGGSVMDLAKAVSLLATQKGDVEKMMKGEEPMENRRTPSLMIPTTAGSGSESTRFAVLNIDRQKYSVTHESLVPDYVILDPVFLYYCNRRLAACAGIDALCQAVESFWSVNATDESKEFSKDAIRLILPNIVPAVTQGNKTSQEKMLLASNLAGKAINIAETTICHAVSYPMTSFFSVPHGHAVALTLPHVLVLNSQTSEENLQDKRGIDYVKKTIQELVKELGRETPEQARDFLLGLMKELNLKTRLHQLGMGEDDIQTIVEHGFSPQRARNNPRKVSPEELRGLLGSIL